MMKYENTAEIGDVIKAFDFEPMPGRGNCYVVGTVVSKGLTPNGYAAYGIEVTSRMWDGKMSISGTGDMVYVPFETMMEDMFPGYDNRVTKIEGAAA